MIVRLLSKLEYISAIASPSKTPLGFAIRTGIDEERFMAADAIADAVADVPEVDSAVPRLPAMLLTVRDTTTQKVVGCCTLVGCVKVRDAQGSRLLSGREAETYIVEAQVSCHACKQARTVAFSRV